MNNFVFPIRFGRIHKNTIKHHRTPGNSNVLFLEHSIPAASRTAESSTYIYQTEGNPISYKTHPHNMMSTHALWRNDVIIKNWGQNDVKTHYNEKSRIFMNIHDWNTVLYLFIDNYWNDEEKIS